MTKLLYWICLIITFSSFPYIGNYLFASWYVLFSAVLILGFTACTLSFYSKENVFNNHNQKWIYIWLIYLLAAFIYAILLFLREGTLFDFRRFVGLSLKIFFVLSSSILILRSNNFVKLFLKVNYVISIGSIVLFLLAITGVDLPHISFTKLDGREHQFFFIGGSNAVYNWGGITALRIAGFADEPGAFALMINYFLVINELTVKKTKYRVIFTISGILTLSLAFYVTFIFFIIYWVIKKVLTLRTIIFAIILGGIIITTLSKIFPFETVKKLLDTFLLRFEYDNTTGKYEGDNRSESFSLQLAAFKEHILLGLGDNLQVKSKYELYNLSFLGYLANYGLYGLVFFFSPIYMVLIRYILRSEMILLSAIFVSYLQRPGVEDMFSMVALSFIFFYSSKNVSEQFK